MAMLLLGAVVSFGVGFAHHPHRRARRAAFERHVAEVCVEAARRTQETSVRTHSAPVLRAPSQPVPNQPALNQGVPIQPAPIQYMPVPNAAPTQGMSPLPHASGVSGMTPEHPLYFQ